MKVLLLKMVEKLGTPGLLADVSDGYARNFLIPRGLAVVATDGAARFAGQLKASEERRRQKEEQEQKETAGRLSGVSCTISRLAAEDEKLFGSVSPADVAEALGAQGFAVDRKEIVLDEPIKALGVYTVTVRLGQRHEAQVKVWVVREAEKKD